MKKNILLMKEQFGSKRFNNIRALANAYLGNLGELSESTTDDLISALFVYHYELTRGGDLRYQEDIDIATDVYSCAVMKHIQGPYGLKIAFFDGKKANDDLVRKLEKEVKS